MNTLSAATLTLAPIRSAKGTVNLPGSKSTSIRALLMAAYARGSTRLSNLLDSDDTKRMREALAALGFQLDDEGDEVVVTGAPAPTGQQARLFLGNSGLSMRTLLPALAFSNGSYCLEGIERMHERPIGALVDVLRELGAAIRYQKSDGFPPLLVDPAKLKAANVAIDGTSSSQFLTGMLQAAPIWRAREPLHIAVKGQLISRPYVSLTLDLMHRFGVAVEGSVDAHPPSFMVPEGAQYLSPGALLIEGDASSASYFLALGALTGGSVKIEGVAKDSVQPDIQMLAVLERMGASVSAGPGWVSASSQGVAQGFRFLPIDCDLNHMPDAAMTVAVLCLFASGPSRLSNIGSWRVKETDRLKAMACELRKFGAQIEEGPDWIGITPARILSSARVATYDDHRMAMSLALVACGGVAVEIEDPACVAKTFPDYFERLLALTN